MQPLGTHGAGVDAAATTCVTSGVTRTYCSVLVTDLDNTLWDWFEIWSRSFNAMLSEVVRMSGIDRSVLEAEIKEVHERHRTSEYALLLQELPSLQRLHPGGDIPELYNGAIHAHRRERKNVTKLYDGVREALEQIKASGALVIGYTESMAFYTSDRLRRTGIDDLLDFLYSAPDHDLPADLTPVQLRSLPDEYYAFRHTVHRHTARGAIKPNPDILRQIVRDSAADPTEVVYVGDSLMKDVAMAQAAGIRDVWAKYGEAHRREGYEQLRRVSHWTEADVERERSLTPAHVVPTHTIESFRGLLDLFSFGSRSSLQQG